SGRPAGRPFYLPPQPRVFARSPQFSLCSLSCCVPPPGTVRGAPPLRDYLRTVSVTYKPTLVGGIMTLEWCLNELALALSCERARDGPGRQDVSEILCSRLANVQSFEERVDAPG